MKDNKIKILLDCRAHNSYSEGIIFLLNAVRDSLRAEPSIDLFYFVDETTSRLFEIENETHIIKNIEQEQMGFSAYISSYPIAPECVLSSCDIVKFALLDRVIPTFAGSIDVPFFEEYVKLYQTNYDLFVSTSKDILDSFIEVSVGINYDRCMLLPIEYTRKNCFKMAKDKDDQIEIMVLYRTNYDFEFKKFADGYKRYKKENERINVTVICDGDDSVYNLLLNNYGGSRYNFNILKNKEYYDTLRDSDGFVDVFSLEDINCSLTDYYNTGKYIISNSLTEKNDRLINVDSSIFSWEDGLVRLEQLIREKRDYYDYRGELNISPIIERLKTIKQIENHKPLVTVVTITYNLVEANRVESINQCIESVHNQTYQDIEHLIIDGASDDGTLGLFKEYEKKDWIKVYSEPDKGLYDAMNKGIKRARGKYIAFLNSDDFYHDPKGIEDTVCCLEKVRADYAFSDTNILNEDGTIYFWQADIGNLLYARNYCHQSLFVKLDVMKELNGFDLNYRVSSDSDLMIRLYAQNKSFVKVNKCFVTYRGGGLSAVTGEESRRDHSSSFAKHIGRKYLLTSRDCYHLWQYRFLDELGRGEVARLLAKVPAEFNSEALINEYTRRISHEQSISLKSFLARKLNFDSFILSRKPRVRKGRNEMVYYLGRIIPIWITKERL